MIFIFIIITCYKYIYYINIIFIIIACYKYIYYINIIFINLIYIYIFKISLAVFINSFVHSFLYIYSWKISKDSEKAPFYKVNNLFFIVYLKYIYIYILKKKKFLKYN